LNEEQIGKRHVSLIFLSLVGCATQLHPQQPVQADAQKKPAETRRTGESSDANIYIPSGVTAGYVDPIKFA